MVEQRLKPLALRFQARVDTELFKALIRRRSEGEKIKLCKGLEANFLEGGDFADDEAAHLIRKYRQDQIQKIEQDLFKQKSRLTRPKEKEVAQRQIERLKLRRERLVHKTLVSDDYRIFAFDWAPVLIQRKGESVIVPMRYHLRARNMTADFDRKYPGCYNARRDSLTGFWRNQFGKTHAILLISGFFENVKKHDYEKRELKQDEKPQNLVLHFTPKDRKDMVVPCIWDHWEQTQDSLDSFALITDEPPPEVEETGHNRCPIFLKESEVQKWLNPSNLSDDELFAVLDDREKPFYIHELAA